MTVEDHPQVLMCLHLGLLLEETYIASQVLHILTVSGYTIIKTTGDTLWDDDNNFCAGVSGCMSLHGVYMPCFFCFIQGEFLLCVEGQT